MHEIDHVAFSFSWCGYGNGLSFKEIGDTDIEYIENFVRNELEKRLTEICERYGKQFDESEKGFFFGIYASSIGEFKFLRGERIQISSIADILRTFMEKNGTDAFKKEFEPPNKFKIGKGGTIQSSVGLVYGEKRCQVISIKNLNPNELCVDLLPKLKRLYEKHGLSPLQPIDEKVIKIISLENGLRADVVCVCCPANDYGIEAKKHAVQYDKTGNWIFSNISKHLKRHVTNQIQNGASSLNENGLELNNQSVIQSVSPQKVSHSKQEQAKFNSAIHLNHQIMAMPIHCVGDDQNESSTSSIKHTGSVQLLYQQFTAQNLALIKATMINAESKKFVSTQIGGRTVNLNTLDISKNGNCMFGSLAHQLHLVKTNSKEHTDLTAKLRSDVVNHILQDIDRYKRAIEIDFSGLDVDAAAKEYISTDLSKNGEWGGSESLLAVINMFKVNILVFQERGSFSFSIGFNPNFHRCVFLAYRICGTDENGEPKYNHYESVCEIDEEHLYQCAQYLGSKMDKEFDCK